MAASIAGHYFESQFGVEKCTCGITWTQICDTREEDIGKLHIAHIGELNKEEYKQIAARRDAIWEAVQGVATGA